MDIRLVEKEDYENILCKWWNDWRWTPPTFDMLPKTAIIISNEGIDICAGFLYQTDSSMAWLEYIVSNFEYKKKEKRKEAIEFLINILSELAKDNGYKYIYTSLKSKSLIERYANCGFITGDSNCQEMIKILCQQQQQQY
jgi:hypothetical protein